MSGHLPLSGITIHHAEHGDVGMQRGTFHECTFQLFEFALVLCGPRADVRDRMSRSWNRYMQ